MQSLKNTPGFEDMGKYWNSVSKIFKSEQGIFNSLFSIGYIMIFGFLIGNIIFSASGSSNNNQQQLVDLPIPHLSIIEFQLVDVAVLVISLMISILVWLDSWWKKIKVIHLIGTIFLISAIARYYILFIDYPSVAKMDLANENIYLFHQTANEFLDLLMVLLFMIIYIGESFRSSLFKETSQYYLLMIISLVVVAVVFLLSWNTLVNYIFVNNVEVIDINVGYVLSLFSLTISAATILIAYIYQKIDFNHLVHKSCFAALMVVFVYKLERTFVFFMDITASSYIQTIGLLLFFLIPFLGIAYSIAHSAKERRLQRITLTRMLRKAVSDKARMQEKISNANQELVTTKQELETKNFQIRCVNQELTRNKTLLARTEKMVSIGNLAAGVAHEINNPIGFISSNLQTLRCYLKDIQQVLTRQNESVDAVFNNAEDIMENCIKARLLYDEFDVPDILSDSDELINDSLEGAKQVRRIVSDLKEFSHKGKDSFQKTNLNELVEKVLTIASNEIKYKAKVVKKLAVLPDIMGDSDKLGQVVLNLVVNAAHSITKRGQITISTHANKTAVFLTIKDTGVGMSTELQRNIFDPFFTTKDVGKGTGLGLYVSKNILVAHGGKIYLSSKEKEGTSFMISLPIDGPGDVKEKV